jgi:hypothetical protein
MYILTPVGPLGSTYVPLDFLTAFRTSLDEALEQFPSPRDKFALLVNVLHHFPDDPNVDGVLARHQWGWRLRNIVLHACVDIVLQRQRAIEFD